MIWWRQLGDIDPIGREVISGIYHRVSLRIADNFFAASPLYQCLSSRPDGWMVKGSGDNVSCVASPKGGSK